MTRYECIDPEHNVWICMKCGFVQQFEADGAFENGFDFCPHCGEEIK